MCARGLPAPSALPLSQTRYNPGVDHERGRADAARYAERIREECLDTRQSLAFETVFSTDEKLSFVRRAIDRGFFVRLFYVSTDNSTINAARKSRHNCTHDHE